MVQGVIRLEKEFGSEDQFRWLRSVLCSKDQPIETEWVDWDPLNSYTQLFEDYVNPTGTELEREFLRASLRRKETVFPGGRGAIGRPVLNVLAIHSHWVQMRSERHYHTLAEAVAMVNRQLDVHGKRILIARIITLEDPIYGASDAAATGWLDALVARIRAQHSILDIISWDRRLAPVPDTHFDRDAPHSTHHVADPALPPAPHWRLDRWR
ncbi:hypothetical protein N9L83_00370 [Flavobacteriales bacterium]|nr:hypothetical protein [Flavobacteriales bacterium]